MNADKKKIYPKSILKNSSTSMSLVLALIIVCVVFTIISPRHVFFSMKNVSNILVNSSITLIMAAGATIAMLLGGMDISQYATATLSSVIAALCIENGINAFVSIAILILVAAVGGMLNASCVAFFQIPAVVTTMGTMQIFRGIAYIITNARTVMITDPVYLLVGRAYIYDVIPVSVIFMALVYIVTWYILKYTSFGRKVFAVGGNAQASYLSGISASRIRFGAMTYSAICAGLGGFLLSSQTGAAIPSSGAGSEMTVVSGVILGGISLSGGKGKISGTILGVLVIAAIKNGLTLCNVDSFVQMIIEGAILIAAVLLDLTRNGSYKKKS